MATDITNLIPDNKAPVTYPAEFLRSADEKYQSSEIIKMNLPVVLVGMFGNEIRVKVVTHDFIELGNIIPYIKIAKGIVINQYMKDFAEYGLSSNSDIMICTLPISGPEVFALGDLCDSYVNIPGMIKNLIAGINSISANERTCVLALERIFDHVKRNKLISSKIKQVSIRSLINKRFTRYGVPELREDNKMSKDERKAKKKQFKTIMNNIQDLIPRQSVQPDESERSAVTLSDKLRYWSNYKGISGDCPVDSEENTQIIESLLQMIEDCVCSPTNVLLSIPKVIELLKYLLSDKHFCYSSFKSNLVRTRMNILSKYASDFQIEMEQMSLEALKIIVNDEIKSISTRKDPELSDIQFNPKTIFNIIELNYTRLNAEKALTRFKKYVGLFVDELDLTQSFITGSSIAYATSPFDVQDAFPCMYTEPTDWNNYKTIMAKIYEICYDGSFICIPEMKIAHRGESLLGKGVEWFVAVSMNCIRSEKKPGKKKPVPKSYRNFGRRGRESMMTEEKKEDEVESNKESKESNNETNLGDHHKFDFEMNLIPGADIDIGVEVTDDKEFDTIAQKHYNVVKKYHPYAKMKKEERTVHYYYQIYTDDPEHIATFRKIDIFMSTRKEILTWHLYPVRGMYTIMNATLGLYLSASCIYGMTNHDADYFCYFRSRTQTPEEILLKYLQRGFYVSVPRNVADDVNDYIRANNKWNHVESLYKLVSQCLEEPKYMCGNFNLLDVWSKQYIDGAWRNTQSA
jgi:hypothetical protein